MTWTRRKFIGTTAAGVVAPLSACRRDDRSEALTICSYSGVFEQAYRRAVLEPFARKHPHIPLRYHAAGSSAQTLGALRGQRASPQIDVCLFDDMSCKIATDERLLEPLDDATIPELAALDPRAVDPRLDGIAVTFEHLVLLYSPAAFATPPCSWKVLWDEAHAGRIVVPGPPDKMGVAFTLLANFMAGQADYRESYDAGIASVARMARNVLNWDPKPDVYRFLVNGLATLGVGGSSRARFYAQQWPQSIASTLPQERSILNLNMIGLVRNAPRPEAARQFIRYALGAEAQAAMANTLFYTPTHRNAAVSARTAQLIATPRQMASMLPVVWSDVAPIRDQLSRRWRREILLRR
jgi:putative spermidine/putrescine transport system substrate-binding protein